MFCVYVRAGIVQISGVFFFHSLPKQMLALDKIFTAVNGTSFTHMHRYNQHRIKVPQRDTEVSLY